MSGAGAGGRRQKMDKIEYKKEVEKGCRFMDEKNMKEEMERMRDKKMRMMIKEDCDLKDYVKYGNIYSARKSWEAKCYMLRALLMLRSFSLTAGRP